MKTIETESKVKILLNTQQKVNDFVRLSLSFSEPISLISEDKKYRIDGKSVLGVFSLDLSKPVILETELEDVEEIFEEFILK